MGGPCDSPYAAADCMEKQRAKMKKKVAPKPQPSTAPYEQGKNDISLGAAVRAMRRRHAEMRKY